MENVDWGELELAATREVCLDSYEEFVKELWSSVETAHLIWNWHMSVICKELEMVGNRVIDGKVNDYDLCINVSPGTSKSNLISVFWTPWLMAKKPSIRAMCASYSHILAQQLSSKCRDVVRSERYTELFPSVRVRKDLDAKGFWKNTAGGSRFATSTGSTAVGAHADILVLDDPCNLAETLSPELMSKTNEWITSSFLTRKANKECSTVILVQQRLAMNDQTADMLERCGDRVRHICLPAILADNVRPEECRKYYNEEGLFDPVRMPRQALDEEEKIGPWSFSAQYMQNPIPRGSALFQADKITVVDLLPSPVVKQIRAWDKASSTGRRSDFTVGVLLAKLADGRFAIMDVVRGKWGVRERELTIRSTAETDGDGTRIVLERAFGEGGRESYESSVRNLAGYVVVEAKPCKTKHERAEPCACQINAGNMVMMRRAWNKIVLEELAHFPSGAHDDVVDALAHAFNHLQPKRIAGKWGS